ncbi:M48 family metalloprotease [Hymenobacter sp. RP-2-7]|uniref:M48 family metalloprotease n=1 Tax=Hymenobacter polaris TaxID=2682546 RepID=A0A7Y0AEL5_9BACT|nr:M48 family metallopeptidase [Hymenobacter polaris]NML65645.1 M48 family metalloprotease [Hymenobacter polaris]
MPGMTHEAFATQLERLLPLAQANPTAYRHRVRGWVLLGYGFIALLLLGSLGLMGGLLWLMLAVGVGGIILKLLIPLGYFVWKVLRAMWVKFDAPSGRRLTRAEAGPLYELVRTQTRALRAPTVHQILLTDDYNAAAMQLPRLGLLGWPRNYVLVGLPLLQTLSPAQAAAVVAHELGHLRGGHGRFGALVYRVNASWAQLAGQLARGGGGSLVHRFTDWYVPRFNAWSHPLRRTAEFEADAAAAQLTSPADLAEALCAIHLREPALNRLHWDELTKTMAHEPAPPADTISRLLAVARTARLPDTEEATLLHRAVEAEPDPHDTHPTLGERLAALSQAPLVPALPPVTAAEAWLGASLPILAQELDAEWASARTAPWGERHAVLREQRQQLTALQERLAAGETLGPDDAWTHADLTEDHVGAAEALPLFRALVESEKYGATAKFSVARILVNQDETEGLALLNEVQTQRPDLAGVALSLQRAYYERRGDRQTARQLTTLQYQHADVEEEAQAERQTVAERDTLLAHGLASEELAPLLTLLRDPTHHVAQAWLLRKKVKHFATERPFFLLLVRAQRSPTLNTDEEITTWAEQLAPQLVLPGSGLVVPVVRAYHWLGKRALHTADSEVYKAPAAP